uniref:Putative ATPase domain containing protein n=1 Tax=viral metagenome TaxID=1070528 RepID=A0A6M3JC86_9ZZZZ
MPLDIKKEAEDLIQLYQHDETQDKFNLLLTGEHGTGKTFLLRTARKPVHIDSFDPGGTKCLRDYIAAGDIIADTRYEREDPTDPTVYKLWYPKFKERIEAGYFDQMGTYCLDSSTSWSMAILAAFMKKSGVDMSTVPDYKKHYHFQKFDLRTYIRKMLSLPCDVILTGHLQQYEDKMQGKLKYRYLTTGDGSIIIPTLFDEFYVATTVETSEGVSYKILTERTGPYEARSRLKKGGVLDTYEEPNIKNILRKAKMDTSDKPRLFTKEELQTIRGG